MAEDITKDKYISDILANILPSQMENARNPALVRLNSAVSQYFPKMVEKYRAEGDTTQIKTPVINSFQCAFDKAFYGFVKPVTSIKPDGTTEPSYAVMVDQGEIFHAQASGNANRLLEMVGGLLGTAIRWNYHPLPDNYIPSIAEKFIEKQKEKDYSLPTEGITDYLNPNSPTRLSQKIRNVSFFFEWTGRHVFRDVIDPSWKLEHERYETEVKPELEKSREDVLKRVQKATRMATILNKNTDISREGYETWKREGKKIIEDIGGEWGNFSFESDNPFERFVWEQLNVDFSGGHGFDVDDTLDDDFDIHEKLIREDKDGSELKHYAKFWPKYFKDLAEGKTKVTSGVLFERFFRLKKDALKTGLEEVAENLKQYPIGNWFDATEFPESEINMASIFSAAEDNEKYVLQNLPVIIRMSDEEVRSKFFPNLLINL